MTVQTIQKNNSAAETPEESVKEWNSVTGEVTAWTFDINEACGFATVQLRDAAIVVINQYPGQSVIGGRPNDR